MGAFLQATVARNYLHGFQLFPKRLIRRANNPEGGDGVALYTSIDEIVVTEEIAYRFITCSSLAHGGMNFSAYISPISAQVWIAMIVLSLVIAIIGTGRISVSTVSAIWVFLLLQLIDVVGTGKTNCRYVLWTLAVIVINNWYLSVVTNDITAPFSSTLPKSFVDITATKDFEIITAPAFRPINEDLGVATVPQSATSFRVGWPELDQSIFLHTCEWLKWEINPLLFTQS